MPETINEFPYLSVADITKFGIPIIIRIVFAEVDITGIGYNVGHLESLDQIMRGTQC